MRYVKVLESVVGCEWAEEVEAVVAVVVVVEAAVDFKLLHCYPHKRHLQCCIALQKL